MTKPDRPTCAHLRELSALLSRDLPRQERDGAERLYLALVLLEMRAETCGAPESSIQTIATARRTLGSVGVCGARPSYANKQVSRAA
jgi:hypothetical protein